jgi:glucose 1-dehydrogenase
MRAVAASTRRRELALVDHPEPELAAPRDVKVRVLETGICGTDREICSFAYGEPPPGDDYLILGHEAVGEVVEIGAAVKALRVGDLVVPSVRRPCACPTCLPCREGRQDFCSSADFVERGIKGRHGFMTEYFVESEEHLFFVSPALRDIAVMLEPLTIAEKGLTQTQWVQQRLPWGCPAPLAPLDGTGKTAVVLGAGPVGLLGAMALVARGFCTWVYSRSPAPNPKSTLAEAFGARYVSSAQVSAAELARLTGRIDLVYEAVGVSAVSFEVMQHLAPNGVFVMTGIPAEGAPVPIAADRLMRQIVLSNLVIVGTVNADRPAFAAALDDLAVFNRRWPDAVRALITSRQPLTEYRDMLVGPAKGIKNVVHP